MGKPINTTTDTESSLSLGAKNDEKQSCPIGGCGATKGMCPGIALAISIVLSSIASSLMQMPKIQLPLMIVFSIILVFGFYPTGGRWFKARKAG